VVAVEVVAVLLVSVFVLPVWVVVLAVVEEYVRVTDVVLVDVIGQIRFDHTGYEL
jgi:hypothetical protein